MKKILIILVVLIVVGATGIIVYKYIINKPHPEIPEKETEVRIRAKRLWTDYSMNEDIADPKYTGKVIEIKGGIMRVEVIDDNVVVVFAYRRGDLGDEGIRVTMRPEYHQAAKGINLFKPVTIKGHCTGYNGQDITMENGSIVGSQ